jgi:hypothetical protein
MKKMLLVLVLLATARLVPKALRQQTVVLELVALAYRTALTMTANTAMTYNLAGRTATLETTVGKATSQAGTTSTFSQSVGSLTDTETGLVETSNIDSAVTDQANATSSGQTSSAGSPAHVHDYGGHNHGMNHYHFTQLAGDWSSMGSAFNGLVTQLNTLWNALHAAGLV